MCEPPHRRYAWRSPLTRNVRAVLLIAGDKQGVNESRFYRKLIAKADMLYARHLHRE